MIKLNNLAEQFFKAFNIDKEEYCERIYQDKCNPNCSLYSVRKTGKCFKYRPLYPEITNDTILKIFAKICWSYTCTQNDFTLYEVSNKKDLIKEILSHAILLSKNDQYIYDEVRKIFGVEDD